MFCHRLNKWWCGGPRANTFCVRPIIHSDTCKCTCKANADLPCWRHQSVSYCWFLIVQSKYILTCYLFWMCMVFSPHTLFNGICCRTVVCVSWHQQQRKSTLGLREPVLLVCLCHLGFFELAIIKANSAHKVISRPKLMDTSVGLWWESSAFVLLHFCL